MRSALTESAFGGIVPLQFGKIRVVGGASPTITRRSKAAPFVRLFLCPSVVGVLRGCRCLVAGLAHLLRSGTTVQGGVRVQSNTRRLHNEFAANTGFTHHGASR